MPPRGRSKKKQAVATADPPIPERRKNHRTKQNPWEASKDDETYEVDRVISQRHHYGAIQYEIVWKGFSDTDTTWEPIENLCEATTAIRHFRKAREERDAEDKRLAREAKVARRAQYDEDQEELRVKATWCWRVVCVG